MWLDVLHEAQGIRAIYGDNPPSLESVTLHEICLHHDGPRVTLRVDLPEYPIAPPKKWADQGFNVVQVKFMFTPVTKLSIEGWSSESWVSLAIEKYNGIVKAVTLEGSTSFHIEAKWGMLNSISAYREE